MPRVLHASPLLPSLTLTFDFFLYCACVFLVRTTTNCLSILASSIISRDEVEGGDSIFEKCLKKQGVGNSKGEHKELNLNAGFSRKVEATLQGVK